MNCKYILATIVVCLTITPLTFSQQEITVNSPEYQQAKQNGTLDQYTISLDLEQQVINGNATPIPAYNTAISTKSSSCDCYVEPDATYSLALSPNDDGSSSLINLPFSFNFYGTLYNSLYINNNGNITFENSLFSFSSNAFPSTGNKIIAPFWADVDTRAGNGQVLYKITQHAIYVNWEDVGYFNQQGDKLNTFQLILTDGTDPAVPDGNNISFCYKDMQWTTGSASQGVNGFGGIPATCGANKGDGVGFFQIGRFDHAGIDFDGPNGNNDGISYLDNKSYFFNISDANNITPIPQGVSACDTFKICSFGDTADIQISFLSPELNQTTAITYDMGGLVGVQEISNTPGNFAFLTLRIIGDVSNSGIYNCSVTATDDYAPTPGVTTVNFVVVIDNTTGLNPQLDYTINCGSTSPIDVLNGPYDGYLWDNGTSQPTAVNDSTGVFGVTVNLNGCYKRIEEYFSIPQPAAFNLEGNLFLCPGEDSTLLSIGQPTAIGSINWDTGNLAVDTLDSIWLQPGTYHIYNVDTSGACNNDTVFTISQGSASTIFNDTVSCNDLTFQVTGAVVGTSASWSSPDPEISFSSITANNPVITATDYGIYTINLSNPCAGDLTAELIFTYPPSIFEGDTICGDTLLVDSSLVSSFDGGIWSSVTPGIISYSNDTIENPIVTTNTLPFSADLVYTDKYCPSLSDHAIVLFVQSGIPEVPSSACNLGTFDLNVNSFEGGTWSIIDNTSTPWAEDTAATFPYGDSVGQPGLTVTTPGMYNVHYHDNFCNVDYDATINFTPYIYTEAKDTNLCFGVEYELGALAPDSPVNYFWSTGETTQFITITEPGNYIATVSNECYSYSDTATIEYYLCDIQAPNVISLSSQAGNNVWFVNSEGIADFNCVILNRWGNVVYEYNDVNGYWDGRNKSGEVVADGVYSYIIKAKLIGGDELTKHGFVTVIR